MDELDTEIGKHLMQHCLELGDIFDHTHEDVSWSYTGWSIKRVYRNDRGNILVEATQEDTVSERASRTTRHHPAEYEHHDVEVHAIAEINFGDNYLCGDTEVAIEDTAGHAVGQAYGRSEI